jgi:class 3 adenylate cyclase/tetratricopeptide (TPR) repeat protein
MPACPACGEGNPEHARFCHACGSSLLAPDRESRRRVTVLFCDLADSTAMGERLDPEVLRRVLSRYYDTARGVVEQHGGVVEKFVGDAVMAVFGVPVLHEDDALRAVRAAAALRERTGNLNDELEREYGARLTLRIGVNTGEVITGTEDRLAVGDAVNVAARLEQSAGPDEILLGSETFTLVRTAVIADSVEPLTVKGKSEPLSAWRLVSVHPESRLGRHFNVPMIGRGEELRRLLDSFERAQRERRCELVTILGPAGVGKSRLAHEFLASLDWPAVVRGRCIPYGEGITYLPVIEIVRQLESRLAELELDPQVVATLRSLLDAGDSVHSTEEISFAVRRLLEATARARPLVCVVDDIQWGEPALLELLEQLAVLSHETPLVLCCLARPDLMERRPDWIGAHSEATTIVLEPLSADETGELIEHLAGDDPLAERLMQRVREAAEGNPLFVEEMVAFLRDAPAGEVTVPGTIAALLSARLDQLEPEERAVLQRAAVEGRVFHRGAVQALGPDEAQVGASLTALVRKELIRPDRPQFAGEDAFRFRHLLIRDAAYDSLPKEARAQLHERLADWLEQRRSELAEIDELVGHHLEQAHAYRVELRPVDDHGHWLALRASDVLSGAGSRALGRNDVGAAVKLLGRALALRDEDDPNVTLRLDLGQALFVSGDLGAAGETARDAAVRAAAARDEAGELRARLLAARVAAQTPSEDTDGGGPSADLLAVAEEARSVFARGGDELGLAEAWFATAWAELIRCRWAAMLDASRHALEHARRGGSARWEGELPVWQGTAMFFGPTPADEALRWFEEQQAQHPVSLTQHAILEAMRGNFDRARTFAASADAAAAELGQKLWLAAGGMYLWEIEMLAGDLSAAERAVRRSCELLGELGEVGHRSTAAGQLAASLYALARLDEAHEWTETAEGLAPKGDVSSQMLWRQVRARVLARRGDHATAEELGREAVVLAEATDMLNYHANALADLAEIYVVAGRAGEGRAHLEQALALYERKGNLVAADRAGRRLEELKAYGASREATLRPVRIARRGHQKEGS